MGSLLLSRWGKPLVFAAGLLPLAWLIAAAATNQLGANPAEALVQQTGLWTLRLLCLALAITPLRQLSGVAAWARYRRMVGLYVFAYASLHLLAYAWLDMGLDATDIVADIAKRPFILVGFLAWLALLAMAATSFQAAVRWLGGKRWQTLHRVVYAVAALAVLHFFWKRASKSNFADVAVYASVLGLLLGWRVLYALRHRRGQA
jgi:methionine sulfoxide reductase heme-binding subunit